MSGWVQPGGAGGAGAGAENSGAVGSSGSIFDLGYQRYGGVRLGRRGALWALFRHALGSVFGIGRGGRAKLVPWTLFVLATIPAIIGVGFAILMAQAGDIGEALGEMSPIRYDTYLGFVTSLVLLFCAAQGTELFGRDQRYGVLPLYFSRAIGRLDYALAKVGGLVVALLVLVVVPQVVIFAGRVLVSADLVAGLSRELPSLGPVAVQGLLTAGLMGGLTAVVAAHAPRRAYATAAVIAIFILPPVAVAAVQASRFELAGTPLALLSPLDVLEATNAVVFGLPMPPATFGISGVVVVAVAVAGIVVAAALTARRYLRIAA